ncbi:MAG: cystathionine beta-lyase/cystathionine gamma-synthase [Flavobacteriales bacterium]|jgi:cystathionine beta-lyase/cystathionine gamma-synthase
MHLSEILNHLGEDRKNYYNAICPPIIQSSNFSFDTIEAFRAAFRDEFANTIYTRGANPTVNILRKKLAALEGSEDALVFGSGVAAIAAAVIGNVKSGDHIICVQEPYGWTYKLLTRFLDRFNVSHTFVDGTSMSDIENAVQPSTTVLYLESPNSATCVLQDLAACAALCKKKNLISIIDNSYCSPIFQKPISFGIDIVVHSGTKYLNGHSDVVVGVLAGTTAMVRKIFASEYMTIGAIISPNDASLVTRGLRTLELRMKQSDESARKVIDFLDGHPKIASIHYPFHKSFPQYELAKKQMSGCGGLFSVMVNTDDIKKVEAFFHRLKRFLLAVSWGGHESLVLPFAAFHEEGADPTHLKPWQLVRFYIGLEDPDWLIEDLREALEEL